MWQLQLKCLIQINPKALRNFQNINCPISSSLFMGYGKTKPKPNPLAPFPTREGGKFKASPLAGERFGERFSRSREKSDFIKPYLFLIPPAPLRLRSGQACSPAYLSNGIFFYWNSLICGICKAR